MPSDRPNEETAPRDADTALGTMAHDARNGLATIIARAQMLARRLRRGEPVDREGIVHGVEEIEGTARRTARRIDEIEEGARAPRERRSGS